MPCNLNVEISTRNFIWFRFRSSEWRLVASEKVPLPLWTFCRRRVVIKFIVTSSARHYAQSIELHELYSRAIQQHFIVEIDQTERPLFPTNSGHLIKNACVSPRGTLPWFELQAKHFPCCLSKLLFVQWNSICAESLRTVVIICNKLNDRKNQQIESVIVLCSKGTVQIPLSPDNKRVHCEQ